MIWGAFSALGKLCLAFVSGWMNSKYYQGVLNTCLIPFLEDNKDGQLVFMQDNAPIHTSHSTRNWLAKHSFTLASSSLISQFKPHRKPVGYFSS